MKVEPYDIVIVGGGLVGNSLALALANTDWRIAIVETIDYTERADLGNDNRAIGLSYTSERILQKLGVWSHIKEKAHPIDSIHISREGRFGIAKIVAAEQGLPSLGCHIEIHTLQKALAQHVQVQKNLKLYAPYQVTACTRLKEQWQLSLNEGEENISARLLVAADGSDSWIRRQVGIKAQVWDYQQSALVSQLSFSRSLQRSAYERFTRSGLMAVLPMGDKTATFIGSLPREEAARWQSLSQPDLLSTIQAIWGYRLGRLFSVSKPIAYPLKRLRAAEICREGLVLIGNAGQTVHPVAAQGFNLGLRSAMVLAEVLQWAQQSGRDYSTEAVLKDYVHRQAADRRQIEVFTHFLVTRFALDHKFGFYWQSLALGGLEWMPQAKSVLARLGLGGAQKSLWV